MKKLFFCLIMSCNISAMDLGVIIEETKEERNIILDINDPEVQKVIHEVVSASIHEAFENRELQKELEKKKKCCNSDAKVKAAIITATCSTIATIITIILNNK